MRSDGTPIIIAGEVSRVLQRKRIGGKDGSHDEKWLQTLLHRHPTCIPMDQIEPGLRELVPVCMELPLPSGYVDNLLITPEGDIVIVEAKLWRNPEARREVVAQALDYANSLFGMDYVALESAALKGDFDGAEKPTRLYDIFNNPDTLDEPAFVDAVNTNLRNGRIVVLVVGDGIRTDAESLVDGLQSHAGFHFTFALIELAIYRSGQDEDLIAVPRTLVKTYMVERGIVRIEDDRAKVIEVQPQRKSPSPKTRQSITSEQFYDAMRERHPELPDAIKVFLDKLGQIGVYPEFRRSLIFKWEPPAGNTINLGYILRDGQLWTDVTNWSGADKAISDSYITELAEQFGGEVIVRETGKLYAAVNGKAPYIEDLVDQFDSWLGVIERFQNRIHEFIDEAENNR